MLYIFLDESGTHKKFGYYTIALVYVIDKNIELLNQVVIQSERELHIHYFHWSEHTWNLRKRFLYSVLNQDFLIKIAVIKNPFNQDKFEEILKHLIVEKNIRVLMIDGKKSRAYKQKLKKVLRSQGIYLGKLITANDKSFPVLRIADLCAGLVRTYYNNKDSYEITQLYKKLQSKILVVILE